MFETSEQRIKLLKAGFSGKEIERLYIKYNNFKIVYSPILYEISEFNGINMKMKILKMKQLDEKDEEIADALKSLGMSRNAALTLAYMQNANSATLLDIEIAARLHQPEVSIAIKQLKERDWICEREKKNPGKWRYNKIYSLKVDLNDIIAQLENMQRKTIEEAGLERFKELG